MRNSFFPIRRTFCAAVLVPLVIGCAAPDGQPVVVRDLAQVQESFDRGNYNQAVQEADSYLRTQPTGRHAAATYYLKGRAYEEMTAASAHEAQRNLSSARTAYVQGLHLNPDRALRARLQAAVANVAYHQEDYTTALQQWSAAYEPLDTASLKPWVLYRIGLCQQRLGRFADADRTFAAVKQHYANTPAAARAESRQGARNFQVQLGVFSTAQSAERIAAAVRAKGINATLSADGARTVVRAGPVSTYAEARTLKMRLADIEPSAMIVP